ncbi:MAG: class I SAM-dependent methyltransferase [Dehalococcoidia bacterium]|nr:class I SAM-dependent methyltransferase [Dehalococcoidia bacterium]
MKRAEYRVMFEIEDGFWWYVGMRAATARILDATLPPADHRRVLDAGCGTGANLMFLRRYGAPVGVDLSSEAIRFARRRDPDRIARGSVTALPFADGVFDLVTSFEVIYHLGVADDRDALREFARVTKPGGYVLTRVPAYDWLRGSHDRAVQTRRRYTVPELREKLRAVGLTVVRASYLNATLFPVAAAKRLAEAVVTGPGDESDLKPIHPGLNRAFAAALRVEGALVARRVPLPFGLSVVCLARKD